MKNIRKKRTRIQKAVSRITAPYSEHWEAWTKSEHCFLTEQEVQIVELIDVHGKQRIATKILKIPLYKISTLYCSIKRKLVIRRLYYERWKKEIFPMNLNKGKSKLVYKKAEFLNASFYSRYFPDHLGRLLSLFGENLFEVLMHFGKKELAESRWFGKRRMDELLAVLKKNKCEDLLRKSIPPKRPRKIE
jgi:hypothetical protein